MNPRTRSRGTMSPANAKYQEKRGDNCSMTNWQFDTYLPICHVGAVEAMTDYVVPRFSSRVQRGEVFFNPMYHEKITSNEGAGIGPWHRYSGNTCSSPVLYKERRIDFNAFPGYVFPNGAIPAKSAISDSDLADLQTEVSTRCLASRGNSDNNLFESLAEINQTVNMLDGAFQRLNTFFYKNRARALRFNPADAWLAGRYGVLPILNDVSGILDGMVKPTGRRRKTTRARGSLTRFDTTSSRYTGSVTYCDYIAQTNDSVTVRAMSLDEYFISRAENIGFSTKGLLTLPWELIPYSFVVDWFANVSDYLNAIIPLPGLKQLGSCLVTERTRSTVYSTVGTGIVAGSSNTLFRPWQSTFSGTLWSKTRSVLLAPDLVIKSDFKLDSAVRQADALSLIVQRLGLLYGKRR